MRRAIFIVIAACSAFSCSSSTATSGAQGKADFAFFGTTAVSANKPIAAGSDVTLEVDFHDPTDATFQSSTQDVLAIVSSSHTTSTRWFVTLHSHNEGKSRITASTGTTVIDTIDLEVVAISKLELPSSVDISVSHNAAVTITARGAAGQELYAPSAVAWSIDHPEIVEFWDSLRNAGQPNSAGTALQIHGVAVGSANLTGSYGRTAVTIPVNVK
jgi:hypothetical protein